MKVCTYDNPATWMRECWQDGRLRCAYSADLWLRKDDSFLRSGRLFFGANVGPWNPGQLLGDEEAMAAIPATEGT